MSLCRKTLPAKLTSYSRYSDEELPQPSNHLVAVTATEASADTSLSVDGNLLPADGAAAVPLSRLQFQHSGAPLASSSVCEDSLTVPAAERSSKQAVAATATKILPLVELEGAPRYSDEELPQPSNHLVPVTATAASADTSLSVDHNLLLADGAAATPLSGLQLHYSGCQSRNCAGLQKSLPSASSTYASEDSLSPSPHSLTTMSLAAADSRLRQSLSTRLRSCCRKHRVQARLVDTTSRAVRICFGHTVLRYSLDWLW